MWTNFAEKHNDTIWHLTRTDYTLRLFSSMSGKRSRTPPQMRARCLYTRLQAMCFVTHSMQPTASR